MKSKEILPEDLRFTGKDGICWINDAKQGKYDNIAKWIKSHTDALKAAEKEIQDNEQSYLSTIIKRDEEIRKHIGRIQELEKEIKEYKKLAKDNVPELVKMLKNRKG